MGVDYERRGPIAYVVINRPHAMNALDLAALNALAEVWRTIEADDDVRVAIITGAGDRAFSVGADLKNFAPPGTPPLGRHEAFFADLITSKPIVAAVNGYALAGGCELLGATDIRVAADHALFSITEPRVGLFPAGGSAVRYPRQLSWPLAMELLITGKHLSADEALRMGLINKVVAPAELMAAAEEYASTIAALSPIAVRAIKECARRTLDLPLEEAFDEQVHYSRRVLASKDAEEGRRAFLEKRTPEFVGQ